MEINDLSEHFEQSDFEKRLEMRQKEARERIFNAKKAKEPTQDNARIADTAKGFYSNLKANTR